MRRNEKPSLDRLTAHLDHAWDLLAKGDVRGARLAAQQSLEVDGDSPDALYLMGNVLEVEGRFADAFNHYLRAIDLDDTFVEAMLSAAEICVHITRDFDEAVRLVDDAMEWIQEEGEELDALLLKVDALLAKGDLDEAKLVLEALPKVESPSAGILYALGRAHFEIGQLDQAEPLIAEALEKDDSSGDAHYYMGLIHRERNRNREATISFLRSRDSDVRNAGQPAVTAEEFQTMIRNAIAKLETPYADVVRDAFVIAVDLPGVEVVAEGIDPRTPLLLDGPNPEGNKGERTNAKVERIFVYQRNVEIVAGTPELIEDRLLHDLMHEIDFSYPDVAAMVAESDETLN